MAHSHDHSKHDHERMFHHEHAAKLDDPDRARWLPTADVLARLDLRAGIRVADIGAGTGYFTLPLAAAVAPGGRIFAVDMQPEMLDLLRKKLEGLAPDAVELVHGEATRTTLPDASIDVVFVANVWHEIDDLPSALREFARILRPGGRLAILDWRKDDGKEGEVPGPPLSHRIAEADVVASVRSTFQVEPAEHIGVYHYLVRATRA